MSLRLVIPAGELPTDVAYVHRPETWQELADDAGCEAVENLGSTWCTDHGVDGLGVCTEFSGFETEAQAQARIDQMVTNAAEAQRKQDEFDALVDEELGATPPAVMAEANRRRKLALFEAAVVRELEEHP